MERGPRLENKNMSKTRDDVRDTGVDTCAATWAVKD